jgi:hypothetical protein
VRAIQHVFRRGAIYWWRRRVLKKAGESERIAIAISMQTSELAMARTIAAHLTLESDLVLREGSFAMLSSAQAFSRNYEFSGLVNAVSLVSAYRATATALVSSSLVAGGGGTIAFSVTNLGASAAPNTALSQIYLSTNATLDASDILVSPGAGDRIRYSLLRCMSLFLALFGHRRRVGECPPSGEQRTSNIRCLRSTFGTKRIYQGDLTMSVLGVQSGHGRFCTASEKA